MFSKVSKSQHNRDTRYQEAMSFGHGVKTLVLNQEEVDLSQDLRSQRYIVLSQNGRRLIHLGKSNETL